MFPWTRPLTSLDIENILNKTPLRSIFRGTFSRDELRTIHPGKGREAGIINLSRKHKPGTHWTAWFRHASNDICYYDSFGDIPPPLELLERYASDCNVYYNINRDQEFGTVICGQLCILFLLMEFAVSRIPGKDHFE